MKINVNAGENILTRKLYKEIKTYDRQQMENFCKTLYKCGVDDGRDSVKGIDLEDIILSIKNVKGVGEKKSKDIIEEIKKLYE